MPHLDAGVLHELLDGEIPSSQLAPIQAHLAACAECRAKLEEERALLAGADGLVDELQLPGISDEPAFHEAVVIRRSGWVRNLAWAATVVIAAGLGYAARRPAPTDVATATAPSGPTDNRPAVPAPAPTLTEPRPRAAPSGVGTPASPPGGVADPALQGAARPLASKATRADSATDGLAPTARRDRLEAVLERTVQQVASNAPRADSATGRIVPPPPAAAAPSVARSLDAASRNAALGAGGGRVGGGGRGGARIDSISLPDAVRRLGGSLRLIDGLVPLRLEVQEPWVRVVYPGEVVLRQQLVDGTVVFDVQGPRGFPADSLVKLRGRVRE